MSIVQYLMLALLLESTRTREDFSSRLLGLLLLLNAIKSADTLLIWSEPLRHMVLQWHPSLLLLGNLAYWLEGPLLLAYVSSILYRDFRLRWRDLIHLLPAAIAMLTLCWHYYGQPAAVQRDMMGELAFMWTPTMVNMVSLRNLSIVLYGSWCLWELRRYRRLLRENYANLEARQRNWLSAFVGGFVLIALWMLAVHTIGANIRHSVANILGVCSNYFHFFFVTALVFFSLRYTPLFDGINQPKEEDASEEAAEEVAAFKDEQITRIENFMLREKPFLDANINIETMAKRLSLPERTLSRILNQHFGKNFFEFINERRIEEAKQLLADSNKKEMTILDILAESGFSSKSTFNAIFKKYVGITPSQYRKDPSTSDH